MSTVGIPCPCDDCQSAPPWEYQAPEPLHSITPAVNFLDALEHALPEFMKEP